MHGTAWGSLDMAKGTRHRALGRSCRQVPSRQKENSTVIATVFYEGG